VSRLVIADARRRLGRLLNLVKTASLVILGPIFAVGHYGTSLVGGLFGCPYSVPFILCPVCPTPCTFNLIRPGLFGIIIATSIIMGRLFCGIVCPIGIGSGFLFRVKKFSGKDAIGGLVYLRYLSLVLFLYLMFEAALILLGVTPAEGIWSSLILHREIIFIAVIAMTTIFIISSVFIFRPWCRLCPIGTLISTANRFSFLSIERDQEKCEECNECVESCPISLKDSLNSHRCIKCLSCFTACEKKALQIRARWRVVETTH